MPIYPFERTVYPIRYPSPFLVKGSKVKGPGGIVPSSSGDASELDADRKRTTAGKASSADAGPSKGQYVGNSTAQGASTVPTPQPQYQQLTQQYQHQYQQHQVTQQYRPPGPDRSVYTAAGGAALGSNIQIEKLSPEISEFLWAFFTSFPMRMLIF